MKKKKPQVSYRDAGVDKDEGYRAVEKMREAVASTQGPQVLSGPGAFAGLYSLEGWTNPVLVSGTDGVGTKLRLALNARRYEVIGRDCYAMVANDILCCGAAPLFFLDYIACGKLAAEAAAGIVAGMAGCARAEGCAVLGGETAEMPGFYAAGDYDVAGFIVGAVERAKIIDGASVEAGDAVIGIGSDGIHSNGFSLVRSLFPDPGAHLSEFLVPTRLYGSPVRALLGEGARVKGMAHITGGGIPENLPRAIAGVGLAALIDTAAWTEPAVFSLLRDRGVAEDEMRGTFNLGIGFALIVDATDADGAVSFLNEAGERAWTIGGIRPGEPGVCFV